MLPLNVDLTGRACVVVGGGTIGARKARLLVEQGAIVTVVTTEQRAPLPDGVTELRLRPFLPSDLDEAWFAIAATGVPEVDRAVADAAIARRCWCNVADNLAATSVHLPAICRRGTITVAVSTGGAAPALASWLRDTLAEALPDGIEDVAETLRGERAALHREGHSSEGLPWRARIESLLAERTSQPGPRAR